MDQQKMIHREGKGEILIVRKDLFNYRILNELILIMTIITVISCTVSAYVVTEPMTITESGKWQVINDIECPSGNCIVITAPNVFLDGNGYKITKKPGQTANCGVFIQSDHATVCNFKEINGFGQGINLGGPNEVYANIFNNTFLNNHYGIIHAGDYGTISNNEFLHNFYSIWEISSADKGHNQILNNDFTNDEDASIVLSSTNQIITGNTFLNNAKGILFANGGNNYRDTYIYNNNFSSKLNIVNNGNVPNCYWTKPDVIKETNVVGGPWIAGNFWKGWSDKQPSNELGYTDNPYMVVSGVYDTYPLVNWKRPDPTVIVITPTSGQQGGTYPISITGTNFEADKSTVSVSGTGVTVGKYTNRTNTTIVVPLTIASKAAKGARMVTIRNPTTGVTCNKKFTITAGPTISKISPTSGVRGKKYTLTITGTNFEAKKSTVTVSGTGVKVGSYTTHTKSKIVASLTIASGAKTGTRIVTVKNPKGGGTVTGTFTIKAGKSANETGTNQMSGVVFATPVSMSSSAVPSRSNAMSGGALATINAPIINSGIPVF